MDAVNELASNDAVKIVVGAGFSLLVAFFGYQLQLGGRRRRRRKEIRDELELVALLTGRPEALRLKARADALLARYTPDPSPSSSPPPATPPWWVQLIAVALSTLSSKFVPLWIIVIAALGVLFFVVGVGFVLEGIRDNRAADAAERAVASQSNDPAAEPPS